MITIAGQPFDSRELMAEYRPNSVEALTLKTMADSARRYAYDTLGQLTFELALRRKIVNAAKALSRSRFSFEVFHQSRCNPAYWNRTANGGFRLKEGAVPSEAILDIYENGSKYATECATAMIIVYYKALLELFGKDKFNRVFSHIYLMNWHQLDPLIRETGTPRKVDDILPGDRGYFRNPDVDPETPWWQGENVIVLPGEMYYGHGIGVTRAEGIIRGLNAHRRQGATRSAYFMDTVSRPDFKKLAGVYYNTASRAGYGEWAMAHPRICVMY